MLNLLTGVLAASAVVIAGSSECPSVAAVQGLVSQLLPGYESADSVYINQVEGELALEMHSVVHGTVFHRRLPSRHSCAEQAVIAATVIAAWQVDSQSTPAPPPPVTVPPPAPPTRRLLYEAGAAVTATVTEGTFTAGGLLDLLLLPGSRRFGLRLGVLGSGLRPVPIGAGQVNWTRIGLRASGGYRFLAGPSRLWSIDCFADTAVAVAYLAGQGFDVVYSSYAIDVAAGGSVRLGRQLGPVRPFVELAITGWLRPQAVTAYSGSLQTATLPQLEVLLSAGLAVAGAKKRQPASAP
ncbi:MAG TPA: hypothetical protein PLW65_06325 [Pseudomonadota bacterium]|nr:hypothetical protein [Pseudomonadota bacterium]